MDCIICALGNPGKEYDGTRHNVGFAAMDAVSAELGIKINRLRFKSLCAQARIGDKTVLLLKPQTYMNASGIAVSEAAAYYDVQPENILCICDDISLPAGIIRIRRSGSAGGHNGLKSLINMLESDRFPRIKIGVSDRADKNEDLAEWVLSRFSAQDEKLVRGRFTDIYESVKLIVNGDIDAAMAKFN